MKLPSILTMIYDGLLRNSNFKIPAFAALLLILVFTPAFIQAQTDSTSTPPPPPVSETETPVGIVSGEVVSPPLPLTSKFHSPRKASIMSAALPGLGQVYNRKYWKVPIIYAGFGVAGWYLRDNLQKIDIYKSGIVALIDDNPNTTNTTGFNRQQLDILLEQHTQWRDLSYIALAAIYILNIVDASVDAHLFYFDVSPDISLNVSPYLGPMAWRATGLTLTLKL